MGFFKTQWQSIGGNAKWDAIKWSGAAMVAATGYLLHKIGHLPDWTLAAGIFVAALIVFLLSSRNTTLKATKQADQQTPTQIVVQGVGLEKNIEAVEEYYRKNNGQMMQEVEAQFQRLATHFTDAKERERFLIRMLSNGALVVLHDGTWNSVFHSQINLLQELNIHALTLDRVKPYYDSAAAANPTFYKTYSFEQWLAYLRGQTVILQDGNVVQLTVRGKDFLRYLVQEGRSPKSRVY